MLLIFTVMKGQEKIKEKQHLPLAPAKKPKPTKTPQNQSNKNPAIKPNNSKTTKNPHKKNKKS